MEYKNNKITLSETGIVNKRQDIVNERQTIVNQNREVLNKNLFNDLYKYEMVIRHKAIQII